MTRSGDGAALLVRWREYFGETPPVGYLLRTSDHLVGDRFKFSHVRVHSLPHGKRYPTSIGEVRSLLGVHKIVFDIMLGDGPVVRLVGPYAAKRVGFPTEQSFQMNKIDINGDAVLTTYASIERGYEFSTYIETILAIADDEIRVVWLNPRTMNVVAPYDGGVDVVFSALGYDESVKSVIDQAVPDENLPPGAVSS